MGVCALKPSNICLLITGDGYAWNGGWELSVWRQKGGPGKGREGKEREMRKGKGREREGGRERERNGEKGRGRGEVTRKH